jgi:hypothetical protein
MLMRSTRPISTAILVGTLFGGLSACAPALIMNAPVSKHADGWAITLGQIKAGPDEYIGEGGVNVTSGTDETLLWTLVTVKNEGSEEQTFAYDTCVLDWNGEARQPLVVGRPAEPGAEVNVAADRSEAIAPGQERVRQLIYTYPKTQPPTRMRCGKVVLPIKAKR